MNDLFRFEWLLEAKGNRRCLAKWRETHDGHKEKGLEREKLKGHRGQPSVHHITFEKSDWINRSLFGKLQCRGRDESGHTGSVANSFQ